MKEFLFENQTSINMQFDRVTHQMWLTWQNNNSEDARFGKTRKNTKNLFISINP
jgi:hypothetical protein